ncbi:MAG: hypothetical protein ABIM54_00965 [candidate division WOR-3 bacterium]
MKNENLEKKVMFSFRVHLALEQGITTSDIVRCLRKEYEVKELEVDKEKIIWVEKKEKSQAKRSK